MDLKTCESEKTCDVYDWRMQLISSAWVALISLIVGWIVGGICLKHSNMGAHLVWVGIVVAIIVGFGLSVLLMAAYSKWFQEVKCCQTCEE